MYRRPHTDIAACEVCYDRIIRICSHRNNELALRRLISNHDGPRSGRGGCDSRGCRPRSGCGGRQNRRCLRNIGGECGRRIAGRINLHAEATRPIRTLPVPGAVTAPLYLNTRNGHLSHQIYFDKVSSDIICRSVEDRPVSYGGSSVNNGFKS